MPEMVDKILFDSAVTVWSLPERFLYEGSPSTADRRSFGFPVCPPKIVSQRRRIIIWLCQ